MTRDFVIRPTGAGELLSTLLEDLERNKPAAGRLQDLADVEALRRNRASSPESDMFGLR